MTVSCTDQASQGASNKLNRRSPPLTEPRSALAELDVRLVGPCIAALDESSARYCAQILGLLEAEEAIPALRALRDDPSQPARTRRAVEDALARIEGAGAQGAT